MDAKLESRILDLLRAAPAMALPLREVHRVLAAEHGPGTGSLSQFRERLRAHSGALFIIEPENPLGDASCWPAAARSEYEQALREAGLETEPLLTVIAVRGPAGRESPLGLAEIDASLLELWEGTRDPALRHAVASAFAESRATRLDTLPSRPGQSGDR